MRPVRLLLRRAARASAAVVMAAVAVSAVLAASVWAFASPLVTPDLEPVAGASAPEPTLPAGVSPTLPPSLAPSIPDELSVTLPEAGAAARPDVGGRLPPAGKPKIPGSRDVDVDVCSGPFEAQTPSQRRLRRLGCDAVSPRPVRKPTRPAFPDPTADAGSLRGLVASRVDRRPDHWWEHAPSVADALGRLRPDDPPSADEAAGRVERATSAELAAEFAARLAHRLIPSLEALTGLSFDHLESLLRPE